MIAAHRANRHSSVASRAILNPGEHLGDYEILEPIGAGGMGAVYKVRHLISQRVEALKVVLPNASASPEAAERFLREIRLLASLQHANIAGLHHAFRAQDQMVMVMEHIDGVSLRAKLTPPGITLDEALDYVRQILTALDYAHSRGVTHRDIKPSNLMIQPNGVVRLLDFGLASAAEDPELTQDGALLGSPHYMSPEQAMGERADARSDLYSTGVVTYEMVAGKPPYHESGTHAILFAHLHTVPKPPNQWNARVPAELSQIILKALEKKQGDRFQTASEFRNALERVQMGDNGTTLVEAVRAPERKASGSTPTTGSGSSFARSDIEQASKSLALHIGPIAQIIVNRAAVKCSTLAELYKALSEEISTVSQRDRFLATMPRDAANRSSSGAATGAASHSKGEKPSEG
jgi:serine/threonine protein kinase